VEREPEPEIHLRIPAHFPVDFVEDPRQRLLLYERLTRVANVEEVDEIRYELVDRYGQVPAPVENLLEVMKIRRRLVELRAEGLDYNGREIVVSFTESPRVNPDVLIALVQADPARYRVTPDYRVKFVAGPLEAPQLLNSARDLLNRLG